MNAAQIQQLLSVEAYSEKTTNVQLLETHASWVLLTDQFAYKIKKPVKFSFLDFSTLEKRRFYCERELQLNRRLAPEMYLGVVPVIYENDHLQVGKDGEVMDYALKMKRIPSERQMDELLKADAVTPSDIQKLANKVATFHRQAEVMRKPVQVTELQANFADILRTKDFLKKYLKIETVTVLEEAVAKVNQFLQQHAERLEARGRAGFVIDGHGDLHSGNIFLLDEPLIFDCLEFNDDFRRLDMLDEVAFLCMDLDFHHHSNLAQQFLSQYLTQMPCLCDEEDRQIFQYFKLYRANVRLKVSFLKAKQQVLESPAFYKEFAVAQRYFDLLEQYLEELG